MPDVNFVTLTEHDGLCEGCGNELTIENMIEGDLGFYCCDDCKIDNEGTCVNLGREDFHSDL